MNRYNSYKDSGLVNVGEMPAHWSIKKLKHEVTFNDEVLSDKTDGDYEIEYVEISNVQASKGIISTERMPFKDAPSRARRLVRHGDVIVSTVRTYLRAISKIENPPVNMVVSTGFAVIRPKTIEYRFAGYLFTSEYIIDEIISRSVGVSYPAINASELVEIKVVLPPYEDQADIADFLDDKISHINTLIQKKQKMIALLEEEKTAVINEAVTKGLNPDAPMKDSGVVWLGMVPDHWEITKVSSLAECITGFAFKSELYSFENGIKLVRGDNVTEGKLRWGDKTRLWDNVSPELDKFLLKPKDIVIGMDGSKVGKNFAMVDEQDLPLLLVQRVARIRAKSESLADYINYSIGSYNFKYYVNYSKTDPAIPHITLKNVRDFPIILPPEGELTEVLKYLKQKLKSINKIIKKSQNEVSLLQEYRTALISEAVTGKIDVRDYRPEPINSQQFELA